MSPRLRSISTALGVVLLFALPLLPEILGTRVLVFRDAQVTHWPWRRVAMASLESGRTPFLNSAASGTQPLLANPNAVLLYPTVLFERALAPVSAFNLHYLLHVLWAFLGARLLASRMGVSSGSALFTGVAYAFSGMVLSYASGFLNSIAAAAWLPWCAAAALGVLRARDGRALARAALATGLAFGMQLLAGEPALTILTAVFTAFVAVLELGIARRERSLRDVARAVLGGGAAAAIALAFAAPLLLPLRAIFPLTYRGQHLYSQAAFGASPFSAIRALEWLFPQLGGNPSLVGSGMNWWTSPARGPVYIWCVALGVLPLLVVLLAAIGRDFWNRRTIGIGVAGIATWLASFGLALPLYRVLFSIESLRRLRYPIKFYLLTTLCLALLAGFAADRFRERPPMRRALVLLSCLLGLYVAAFVVAGPGHWLDARLASSLSGRDLPASEMLAAFRLAVRADAVVGAIAVLIAGALYFFRRPRRPGYALALLSVALALPWGLPLFVTAGARDSSRPPALLASLRGEGRLYVSPEASSAGPGALAGDRPGLPRYERVARMHAERLLPATGEPFGISYAFDQDPDGSYGWYNRLATEAVRASGPEERSRLLRAYGARWALGGAEEAFPFFRPVIGVVVGGRRLVLHALDDPLPELRWASRVHRRRSLSGALDLVRSAKFEPRTDIVLPGPSDLDAGSPPATHPASVTTSALSPELAAGVVEAAEPGHLIFSRTYFGAWKGALDGAPARILVANARDVAIAVPGGRHRFEFSWDRGPFHRGVLWQAAALACAIAVAAATRARRPRDLRPL